MNPIRYPIGKCLLPAQITKDHLRQWISDIASLPAQLKREVDGLTEAQLGLRYREGGWTIGQVVHHIADSHLHAVARTKWALTEDRPVIKTYEEALVAGLADVANTPVTASLLLLEGLHARWAALLRALTPEQQERVFLHPDRNGYESFISREEGSTPAVSPEGYREISIKEIMAICAWHGRHHLAHVQTAKRNGAR